MLEQADGVAEPVQLDVARTSSGTFSIRRSIVYSKPRVLLSEAAPRSGARALQCQLRRASPIKLEQLSSLERLA